MTVVSSTKYYNRAKNEFTYAPLSAETYPEQQVLEPDDDFYKAISMEDFKERAREVVKAAYKRYKNESDNSPKSASIS